MFRPRGGRSTENELRTPMESGGRCVKKRDLNEYTNIPYAPTRSSPCSSSSAAIRRDAFDAPARFRQSRSPSSASASRCSSTGSSDSELTAAPSSPPARVATRDLRGNQISAPHAIDAMLSL